MGLFRRKSREALEDTEKGARVSGTTHPPLPPMSQEGNVLANPNQVVCFVHDPWRWVLKKAFEKDSSINITLVEDISELPTTSMGTNEAAIKAASTPARRRRKKPPSACPLRIEVKNEEGRVIRASHGSSEAFDGLEDKDELVRTLQRCQCDGLELAPPSRLINWDVTREECKNVVGENMPTLNGKKGRESVSVLKEPMGSRGDGIFFVRNAEEIHKIIEEHKREAMAKTDFLDNLIASKGRIPSWVLQAEIRPCLMIRDRRKFHIRSYAVGVERWEIDDLVDTFVYRKHEIRIAGESVADNQEDGTRSKVAHVTNLAQKTELLDDVPELKSLQDRVELFISQIFAQHLIRDISRRVAISANEEPNQHASKFVVAGLDIMVTEDKRLYLLEVNVNPVIPSPEIVGVKVQNHLIGFMSDLVDLLVGKRVLNFTSASAVAKNHSA